MRKHALVVGLALWFAVVAAPLVRADPAGDIPQTLRYFAPDRRPRQLDYEQRLNDLASPMRLRSWHELLADEPHLAGTPGDHRTIDDLLREFRAMGLETKPHWFWPYLAQPVSAQLELISPQHVALAVSEPAVEGDPYSANPELTIGFNAYSGNGDVTAQVVYANYGRKEDFEKLDELGVSVKGKIVLARYGGNFRGYKAKYAQQHGAAGLVIFSDPGDVGYAKGIPYPEGGWANEKEIQRGSIKALPFPGDPLTMGHEATEHAQRSDPAQLDLPAIPVQPVGWAAAQQIMQHMSGPGVPKGWQGGLPFAYRVTGGSDVTVHLKVEQTRSIVKTANVIARLEGAVYPDQLVIVGCHHDAWCFGASDPLSGLMLVMEAARCFTSLAQQGWRPDRTILFCAWGAEEQGIVGSTEWVEANRQMLLDQGVAYMNLDAATMGPEFGANGSPILRPLLLDAAAAVPQARDPETTALAAWQAGSKDDNGVESLVPTIGGMGGGSDHIGFYFYAGVPSVGLHARGAPGTSYHSNYDNLHWYQQVVGDDYEPALMLTRVVNVAVARLAMADLLPFDPGQYVSDLRAHLDAIEKLTEDSVPADTLASLRRALDDLERAAEEFDTNIVAAASQGKLSRDALDRLNSQVMMKLERSWLRESGLPGRPWFKSLYMAPDETSGYAAWPLPAVRKWAEEHQPTKLTRELREIESRVGTIAQMLRDSSDH